MAKILVVDDEPDIVEIIQITLEAADFQVITAGNGEEALERAREERPDLILLDVMMPKMDGYTACSQLKEIGDRTPIVMLTARGETEAVTRAHQAGAEDYIVKPFNQATLLGKVKKALERR